MKIRFWINFILTTLLIPLAIGCLLIVWLGTTQTGLRFSLKLITPFFQSDQLLIPTKYATGRLIGPFTLKKMIYQHQQQCLSIGSVTVQWNLYDLLKHKRLSLNSVQAHSIRLAHKNGPPLRLKSLNISGFFNLKHQQFYIRTQPFNLANVQVQAIAQGHLTHYKIQGLIFPGLSQKPWQLEGIGNRHTLTLHTRYNHLLNGTLNLHGNLTWSANLNILLAAEVDYPAVQGHWKLFLGEHTPSHAELSLDLLKLEALHKDLKGHISLKSQVSGPALVSNAHTQPPRPWRWTGKIEGRQLDLLEDLHMNELSGEFDLSSQKNWPMTIKLSANHINYQKMRVASFKLLQKGTWANHKIEAEASNDQSQMQLEIAGSGKDQAMHWIGNLKKLAFTSKQWNKSFWALIHPAQIMITPQKIHIDPISLDSRNHESIEMAGTWTPNNALAQIHINHFNLSHIPSLSGQLDANLHVQKTDQGYGTQGSAKLSNGAFYSSDWHAGINHITATLMGQGQHVSYQIKSKSGPGYLNVLGKTSLKKNSHFETRLNITGRHFLLDNKYSPDLWISPNLSLRIMPQNLSIQGSVKIPQGTFSPPEEDELIELPEEVVFIKRTPNTKKPGSKQHKSMITDQIQARIKLILGENVKVHIKGLEGNLKGQLNIQKKPQHLMSASGSLRLDNATYTAYGETLTVKEGRFNYFNSPIDNPSLYVEAVRIFQATNSPALPLQDQAALTVGIKFYGPLKHPKTRLFSNPAGKKQSDILALLILGRPSITINDDNKTALLLKMATALNFGKHHTGLGQLTNTLRKKLGFTELGLEAESRIDTETQAISQNTALVLGKYLSPHLYIKYSLGLLEPTNTLSVRYQLNKHLTLQTQTSQQGNGVDLLYTIEH